MECRAVRSSTRLGAGIGDTRPPQVDMPAAAAARASAELRRARAAERAREVEDSPRVLREKCRELAKVVREAKHLVVYTGAGISTAADIPDYRGPRGVWTRLQRGETIGRVEVSAARPTFTHMALSALWRRGAVKFVVSQNCDGLHVRAGLPRRALAELHGDMFAEACAACRPPRLYLRAFDTTQRTARRRHGTARLCHACGAELQDTIVHFGERGRLRWPLNWAGALRHAARADVILCLGSSLKVLRRYPRLWCMARAPHRRPRLVVVNLQWTPKDGVAQLKINARCDAVMAQVARRLRLSVPQYRARADPLLAHATPLAPPERHTTSRPLLSARDLSPSPPPSDPEDDVPLRRLALHQLCAFKVRLESGEATVLLRREHVSPVPAPAAAPALSELRRFRMRKWAANGFGLGFADERKVKREEAEDDDEATLGALRRLADLKRERERERSGADSHAHALAAAIIARALAVCRARLYPGLHTILAPPPPAPPPILRQPPLRPAAAAQCGWCWRVWGTRRCLWYPVWGRAGGRVWRRVRGRRYLCACCPRDDAAPLPGVPAADDSGWYGKGYRKGRRRPR